MPKLLGRAARRAFRERIFPVAACLAVLVWSTHGSEAAGASDDGVVNPVLTDRAAIEQGRTFYRRRCIICHGHVGGRGPNLFASELSDEQFLEVVINGRKGTLMPAFGARMSPDDVWTVHAFVKSRDRY